jgi:hypothetical protein
MFYFRLNRILIHSNRRKTLFKRRDKTDVEIYCFVTTGTRPLPALKNLTATIDEDKKMAMLKKAVHQAVAARVFTPVENVKDNHVLTFGDTGFVIFEDDKIPDDFHFQLVLIGSRSKQRNTAKLLQEVEKDAEFPGFLKSAAQLAGIAANPAVACGAEIGKFLAKYILRVAAEQDDDQLGLVYQSWNRREHYPHGERKRDDNLDLSGNIRYDYYLFGFEKKPARTRKKEEPVG